MKQDKAEPEALAAELNRAPDERDEHANRARDLEEQLERAVTQNAGSAAAEQAQRDRVSVARALAQRRYGPPLRTASSEETGRGDERGQTGPLGAEPHLDANQVKQSGVFTIAVWQFVLLVVLVSLVIYLPLPIGGPLAAAVVVLLGVIAASRRRRTGEPR